MQETNRNCSHFFLSEKGAVVTYGDNVLVSGSDDSMPRCNHEEAHTRMVFHIKDASEYGSPSCSVCVVDTDVVVSLIGKFYWLWDMNPIANISVFFFHREALFKHPHRYDCSGSGEGKIISPTNFPYLRGLCYCVCIPWEGEEVSMGGMEMFPRCYNAFRSIAMAHFKAIDSQCDNFRILELFTVVVYQQTS